MYQFLNDYRDLKREQLDIEEKLNRSKIERSRWLRGDLEHVSLTKGSLAADLPKHIERDENLLDNINKKITNLKDFIKQVDDLNTQILYYKYVEGKTMYEISEIVLYTYAHIRNIHRKLTATLDKGLLSELTDYIQ